MLRYSILIACGWLLVGCAANPTVEAERQSKIPLETAKADRHGIAFLTLGTQQPQAFSYVSLHIRPVGQGGRTPNEDYAKRPHLNRAYFSYKGTDLLRSSDFSDANEQGGLFTVALPPGDYEIYEFQFTWRNYHSIPGSFFSIPFRVNPGEAVYLGRFVGKLTGTTEKAELGGIFKFDAPERALMEAKNAMSADAALLEKRVAKSRGFKVVDANASVCAKRQYVRCVR